MNVKIGEKIKELRKRDDITQEHLAEVLGVTNQAVSKWESGNSYPDIEYISPIANFFNVTIDYLFDHDTAEKRRKIEAFCAQYDTHKRVTLSLYDERIELMRHALAEFPAEETLLIKLAEVLFEKWLSNGLNYLSKDGYTYPDYKWHKSLYLFCQEYFGCFQSYLKKRKKDDKINRVVKEKRSNNHRRINKNVRWEFGVP